jgi:glyoxylase-like metal-dependent hydrolase (beta-lactamase superfamily II)
MGEIEATAPPAPDYFDDPVSGAAANHIAIGNRILHAISDGYLTMRPEMVGTPDQATAGYDALAAVYGVPRLPLGCFFVPGRTNVLIDTGLGPVDFDHAGRMVGGRLVTALARLGVEPAQVDVVALSHLHADHCGNIGDIATGAPTFPNADVFVGRADWDYVIRQRAAAVPLAAYITSTLLDLERQGRVVLMDGEVEIGEGVRRIDGAGHTPGHSFYAVHDAGERVVLLGDGMYCPQQLAHLDWSVSFDVDPHLARRTRERVSDDLRFTGGGALGSHFPELKVACPAPEGADRAS